MKVWTPVGEAHLVLLGSLHLVLSPFSCYCFLKIVS